MNHVCCLCFLRVLGAIVNDLFTDKSLKDHSSMHNFYDVGVDGLNQCSIIPIIWCLKPEMN